MTDIRQMTVADLCALADQVRKGKPGSRRACQLADRMASAATYLEDAGALAQMLWWASDVKPEAPPDGQGPDGGIQNTQPDFPAH